MFSFSRFLVLVSCQLDFSFRWKFPCTGTVFICSILFEKLPFLFQVLLFVLVILLFFLYSITMFFLFTYFCTHFTNYIYIFLILCYFFPVSFMQLWNQHSETEPKRESKHPQPTRNQFTRTISRPSPSPPPIHQQSTVRFHHHTDRFTRHDQQSPARCCPSILSVCPSVCLTVCLSVCLFVRSRPSVIFPKKAFRPFVRLTVLRLPKTINLLYLRITLSKAVCQCILVLP